MSRRFSTSVYLCFLSIHERTVSKDWNRSKDKYMSCPKAFSSLRRSVTSSNRVQIDQAHVCSNSSFSNHTDARQEKRVRLTLLLFLCTVWSGESLYCSNWQTLDDSTGVTFVENSIVVTNMSKQRSNHRHRDNCLTITRRSFWRKKMSVSENKQRDALDWIIARPFSSRRWAKECWEIGLEIHPIGKRKAGWQFKSTRIASHLLAAEHWWWKFQIWSFLNMETGGAHILLTILRTRPNPEVCSARRYTDVLIFLLPSQIDLITASSPSPEILETQLLHLSASSLIFCSLEKSERREHFWTVRYATVSVENTTR